MEAQQRVQLLRTPMDSLVSLAANFLSAFSAPLSSSPQQQGSTFLLLPLPVAAARALSVLRRLLLLATQAFISIFFTFLSALAPVPPPQPPALAPTLPRAEPGSPEGASCVGRALAHVLSVASRLPVASRKYELVRGLAERLLDDNVRAGGARVGAVNRAALAGAFARTLRKLEDAAGGEWPGMELAVRAVQTRMRWWRPTAASSLDEGFGGPAAEKLAAELLWLGQKMAECNAAREAVVQFGAAARLGSRALPCRAHAPGLAASANRQRTRLGGRGASAGAGDPDFRHCKDCSYSVSVQARQLEGVRAKRRREGGQGRRHRGPDGHAAVLAAAALPRQQRHGRPRAERQGADGDGGRVGGADRQAQLGAARGDPGALAAPFRCVPRHRLAQPRGLLHALVRRVAQAARVTR